MIHVLCRSLVAASCALIAGSAAGAEKYPQRPIRLIAPFPPGGGVDINARLLSDPLGKLLGETIVVDNRGGAAGRLGLELIAKSSPDGYTLGIGGIGMAISRALYPKLPYDTLRDFIPISLLSGQANILVSHPSIPAKTFSDLFNLVRAQPGKLTYGTPGVGSATHLATVLLMMTMKADAVHVAYKGSGPALTALIGNEISMQLSTFASALPHVKSERLRAYAVTTAKRTKPLPDVPTIAESGVPGYEYSTWYGLVAPAGVSAAIIDKVNKATVAVLNDPEIQKRYDFQGLEPQPSTPAEYRAYLKSETDKWAKAVRGANVKLE
jgi:tripartite-type tricarboxylate transporter receptor subunit TctC